MKQIPLTILSTLVLTAGLTSPSKAEPHNARVSLQALPVGITTFITGAELETPLGASPLMLGGNAAYITGGFYAQGTLWLRYQHTVSPDLVVGGLVGLNQTWTRTRTPNNPNLYRSPFGYVVGVSARKEWGSLWAQANPNYVIIPDYMSYLTLREALISGIPWLEVGYRITPSFEMSLRSTITPLTASILF